MTKSENSFEMNRLDAWKNVLAGLGYKGDKTRATFFGDFEYIQDVELTRMWMGEGIGKKIVSVVADDMTRAWIDIDGDPENKIMRELSRLNTKYIMNRAVKWARLYRGSVVVMGLNDGGHLWEPVNWKKVTGIDWLKDYPAPRIANVQSDIVTDPANPWFEDFEYFKVFRTDGQIINAHRSRCLVCKGEAVPHLLHGVNFYYLYWGMSALQSIFQQLKDLSGAMQSVANLLYEFVIGKYKLSGLQDIIAANNTAAVYNRLEIINASKSIINGVLLGENEEYTRDSVQVGGLADLIDRFMMMLSSASNIPMTRLFGRSPAGLNATGESDTRQYYDMVQSLQESILLNPLGTLVKSINVYMKVGTPTVKFKNIWEPTQSELIAMKKTISDIDHTYIQDGVLDPTEVRKSRFEGGYNWDTTILTEDEIVSLNESKIPGARKTAEPDIQETFENPKNLNKTQKYTGTGAGAEANKEEPLVVKQGNEPQRKNQVQNPSAV